MRRVALLLSILALPLAVTATAAANTTQTEVVTVHQTDPFPACSFPLELRVDGSFKVTSYFDNSGTLLKGIVTNFRGPLTLTATNPANGKSTTTQSQTFVDFVTFNPDGSVASESLNGLIYNFVAPGLGTILHSTGRLVFANGTLIFEAGPHAFIDQNTAAFCNYMADP